MFILRAAVSFRHASTRVLYGLAAVDQAPQIFLRTNRNGVPYISLLAVSSVSLIFFGLSFLPGGGGQIWNWAQNLVGVSNQLAWLCIGIASWRFRSAWVKQGRLLSDLKYQNPAGKFAAPIVVVSVSFIILVQGWSSFSPSFSYEDFLGAYIELPLFLILYLFWRVFKKVQSPTLLQIELDSGRYENTDEDNQDNIEDETRKNGKWGWFWKIYGYIL